MKLKIVVFFLLFLNVCCNQRTNNTRKYIYDSQRVFNISEHKYDSMLIRFYKIEIPSYSSWSDSLKFQVGMKGYLLNFYTINGTYKYQDSSYKKHKSFLDSIDFFDSEWFKNEDNLNLFWRPVEEKGGLMDTSVIYFIEKSENTDSLLFRRVHRVFIPALEGK